VGVGICALALGRLYRYGTAAVPLAGEGREEMKQRAVVWLAAWLASALVVGCASQPGLAVSRPPLAPATGIPSPTVTPERTVVPPLAEEGERVRFTVVYDNNAYDRRLRTAWGFACWVEAGGATVLFDTGGDGATLLGNMARLGLDPQAIDAVVLSHIHGDHTGGLAGLLDTGIRPTVYVPDAFPASFTADLRARTDLVEAPGAIEIVPGVYTTGQIGSDIVEQALAVETEMGWVVVTGCAHPGIVEMVRRAKEATAGEVALVMGGFHLGSASPDQIEGIIAALRGLGVQQVAPCHCTGDRARRIFADAYGTDCTLAGVGWEARIGSGE
jgi:7,8-dihydropterin-6-yl-methyl-4-(beta-D-ribofuranosyl)aminobenzene 5'-phosphate synthase